MRNVFVTGGAGFIGSNFIRHLAAYDPNLHIVNYDALTYAGLGCNLSDLPFRCDYTFYHGDICDGKQVRKLLDAHHIDTLINFAAESHVDRSILSSEPFIQTNVVGVRVLLDCALKTGVERFVQVGTDEVYGSLDMDSPGSVETNLLKPRSPYAASKAAADLLALSYYHTHGLHVCVTRSSNNYGKYQYPEKVIPLFITNLIDGKKVPLYGDGLNVRDWLYVDDNCKAIRIVAEKGKAGEIYNIAGECELSNIDLTKRIIRAMELEYTPEYIDYVEDRKGHDRRYSMNCDKIFNEFGWCSMVSFADGLDYTVEWYKEHESWWRPLKK